MIVSIKNKRGLSGVVSAVIMIALIMAAGVIIWKFVDNMVDRELDDAKSCFGVFEKVSINNDYTCHNSTDDEMWVSISIGDIEIDELLISVTGANSESFKLKHTVQELVNVLNYPSKEPGISLPSENGGKTYVITGISSKPDGIYIAPIINGKQCEASDSLEEIDDCQALS